MFCLPSLEIGMSTSKEVYMGVGHGEGNWGVGFPLFSVNSLTFTVKSCARINALGNGLKTCTSRQGVFAPLGNGGRFR